MKEMSDKELCYYYDAKWSFGHKCQNSKLYLLEEVLMGKEAGLSQEVVPIEKVEEARAIEVSDDQGNPFML